MLWASRMPPRRAELDRLPSVLTKDEKNKLPALEKADPTEEDINDDVRGNASQVILTQDKGTDPGAGKLGLPQPSFPAQAN